MNYNCPLCSTILESDLKHTFTSLGSINILICPADVPSHYKVSFQSYDQRIEYLTRSLDYTIMIYYTNGITELARITFGAGEDIEVALKGNLSIQEIITKMENLKILK